MTIFETIGMVWVIFTSSMGTFFVIYSSARWLRQFFDDAKRGRDLRTPEPEREAQP